MDQQGRAAGVAIVRADGGAVQSLGGGNNQSATIKHELADGEDAVLDGDLNQVVLYVAVAAEISFYVSR